MKARWMCYGSSETTPPTTHAPWKSAAGWPRSFTRRAIDFGILYDAEQNSGNDVRRCGEEGLFGSLFQSNIAALGACSFRRVLTTDPRA